MVSALASAPLRRRARRSPQTGRIPTSCFTSNANIQTEALPQDNIAGLDVIGTRTTQVIPAGTADNDRDIHVVSGDLDLAGTELHGTPDSSDPRSGTITTELSNVDRVEPDPASSNARWLQGMDIPQRPLPAALAPSRAIAGRGRSGF